MPRATSDSPAEGSDPALAHRRDRELVERVLVGNRVALDGLVEKLRCAPR